MKRFSKIFAVVLSACLLFGVASLSVFAKTSDENKNILVVGDYTATSTASSIADDYTSGHEFLGKNSKFNKFGSADVDGGYVKVRPLATQTGTDAGFFGISGSASGKFQYRGDKPADVPEYLNGYTEGSIKSTISAITVDFDLGADQYVADLDGVPALYESAQAALDAGATDPRPALDVLERAYINWGAGLTSDSSAAKARSGMQISFGKDSDGNWYANGSYKKNGVTSSNTNTVTLSNKVGVLDHYTLVIYGDPADSKAVITDVYINGELLVSQRYDMVDDGGAGDTYKYIYFEGLSIYLVPVSFANVQYNYSLALDNLAVNYYKAREDGAADRDIDKLMARSIALAECSDVVYNDDYVQQGRGSVAVGNTAPCCNPALFAKYLATNVSNNSKITLDGAHVTDFAPAEGVRTFKAVYLNGASLELEANAANKFGEPANISGEWVYSLPSDDESVTVKWLAPDGSELKSESLALGSAPNTELAPDLTTVDFATGAISSAVKWTWNPYGEDGEELYAVDEAILDQKFLLDDPDSYVIEIKPTVEVTDHAAFAVQSGGKPILPDGMTWDDTKSFANVWAALDNAENGSVVRLYDNDGAKDNKVFCKFSSGNTVGVAASREISLDLGGLNLYLQASNPLFNINGSDVTINIYNGTVYQYYLKESWGGLASNNGIVSASASAKNATVNFGKKDDADAALNYYGGTVFVASSNTADSSTTTLNVYGGTYLNSLRPAYSLFAVQGSYVTINVNDANLINASANGAYGLFGDYTGFTVVGQKISCKNTNIICTTPDGTDVSAVFCRNVAGLTAEFENCLIYGNYRDGRGSITLGAGCRVAGDIADAFTSVGDTYKLGAGIKTLNSNGYFEETFSVSYPKDFYINNITFADGVPTDVNVQDVNDPIFTVTEQTFSIPVVYVTYDEEAGIPSSFADVVFSKDGTDKTYTVKWYEGAKIVGGPELIVDSLNNGWYDLAATGWKQQDESLLVKADGNMLVASGKKPVAHITGVKLNMSLWSHFGMNLYIPMTMGSEVTWNGFYEYKNGEYNLLTSNVAENIELSGLTDKYYRNRYYPTVDNFSQITRFADFTVEYEGVFYTLNQEFTYGIMDYADKVISAYACNTDEVRIAWALVKYKESVTTYMNGGALPADVGEKVTAFYNKFDSLTHGQNCTCRADIENPVFSAEENAITADSYAELSQVVYGVSYTFAAKPVLSVYVKDGVAVDSITVTSNSILGANRSYGNNDGAIPATVNVGGADTPVMRYDFVQMAACDINNVITVTVVSGGETYTGQYCLAEYIETCNDAGAKLAAQSFWAYSKAAYNYKVETSEER